jgi:MmyB-like transcription regulator ligand binding domain
MNELAGTPAKSRRRAPQKVKPYLRRVLDHIDAPAIVITPTHDILAWKPLGAALMIYPRLAELVGDLSIRDAQFRRWWAGTHVAAKRRGTRRYNHPVVGELTLD